MDGFAYTLAAPVFRQNCKQKSRSGNETGFYIHLLDYQRRSTTSTPGNFFLSNTNIASLMFALPLTEPTVIVYLLPLFSSTFVL
jgi:hypothetical protein